MSDPEIPAASGLDEPATVRQCGALAGEFKRLGYSSSRAGRKRRLADTAALLGIDELSSSAELTKGDTGRLVRMLRGCRTPNDLRALLSTVKSATKRSNSQATTATATNLKLHDQGGAAR